MFRFNNIFCPSMVKYFIMLTRYIACKNTLNYKLKIKEFKVHQRPGRVFPLKGLILVIVVSIKTF